MNRQVVRNLSVGVGVALCLFGIFLLYFYGFGKSDSSEITFVIEPSMTRLDVAEVVGDELGWSDHDKRVFAFIYAQIQWDAFNQYLREELAHKFAWNNTEQAVFVTNATQYLEPEYDFISTVHAPGTYMISADITPAGVAEVLVRRIQEMSDPRQFVLGALEENALANVRDFIQVNEELLPDLVPLPPADLVLETTDTGSSILRFSTTYYNQGSGPLELMADPASRDEIGDVERDVFQNIYRIDGSVQQQLAGTFLWHEPHVHYHFTDFVIYDLEAVDAPVAGTVLDGARQKSTFCIRDVSRVSIDLAEASSDAEYKICGKERQGISVGWGDTYFHTYPDQLLNLTDLPSGTYRLSFFVNPENRLAEEHRDNNTSSATFYLDMENLIVELLEVFPEDAPVVEHEYEEQVFD